jgi:predicted HicB family RNase H-like nuclease
MKKAANPPAVKLQLRIPRQLRDFLGHEAKRTFSSVNQQIVQSVAERMERVERERKREGRAA